jgi:hypothetical protein
MTFWFWVGLVIVLLFALLVWRVGVGTLRRFGEAAREEQAERAEHERPEDVADLDVFFVCGVCGTEFQVTRLGETQVPRHCGERMLVERRPRSSPA